MNEEITRKNLEQSIELISELNFKEEDYENIFEKFKEHLNKSDNYKFFKKVSEIKELEYENGLPMIMKKLLSTFTIEELNNLLRDIIKNEDFVDYIQDLFLEKLI